MTGVKMKICLQKLKSINNYYQYYITCFYEINFCFRKLLAAVKNELRNTIKSDLMKKMRTSVAFKIFDQWWEEAKRQLKVVFYFLNYFLVYYNF